MIEDVTHDDRAKTSRRALLAALGIDNLGSGLFLPLAVVYIATVVGIPLATAGLLVTIGTLVGLLAPPLAGNLVDRVGPKSVVVASQVLQVIGMLIYLLATGPITVLLAAALVAAGTQTFYSAVFALIADVAPAGPKDHTFATVEMVRSAAFGLGALVAAVLVSTVDASVLRAALAADAASFVIAGLLLVAFVRPPAHVPAAPPTAPATATVTATAPDAVSGVAGVPASNAAIDSTKPARQPSEASDPTVQAPAPAASSKDSKGPSVLTNHPYLALIAVMTLLGLPTDFLLVGMAVYLREVNPSAVWAAGASIVVLTAAMAALNSTVVRATTTWKRTTTIAVGGYCFAGWAALSAAAIWLPQALVGPWVLATAVLLAAGSLFYSSRVNALAEAAAPAASRGRHLAAFQYSFTAAGLLAPLLVSAMAVGLWLPWLIAGVAALLGAVAIPVVGRRLPASALRASH